MGTRSTVALPTDNGFRGRYVHWDGYPSAMAKTLHALVAQHGLDAVRRTVVEERGGWSSIDPEAKSLPEHYPADRFALVPGYGIAYTPEEEPLGSWITPEEKAGWLEWGYVLNETHLSILLPPETRGPGVRWTHVLDIPWDADAEALSDAIEKAEEAAR